MLRELIPDKNRFTGSLPSTVGELGDLVELSVPGNSFSGNLPPGLKNLQNLVSVDLIMNLVSGNLPPSIGNLKRLIIYLDNTSRALKFGTTQVTRVLDLSWNSLERLIPLEVGKNVCPTISDTGNNNIL
ncbi:hypothetical protein MKW92_015635 [Papaver armeniacum]|nr:hypothetical protein MKW92_015635 [Papaver armeniacum]